MISDLSQEAWDKKVIDLGGSILQSWIWGQFQESMGHKIHRFSSDSYTNLLIEMGLPFGKRYLYSSKGPLGDVQTALTDIQKFSTNPNVVFSRIEPAHTVDLPKAAKDTQPANNWLLNLEPSEDQLLTNMKPKHRYNINLAAKKGVTFREGNKEDILTVWKILMETSTRAGFNLHPQNYYWQMFEVLSPKYLKLLVAEYQGQIMAGIFLTLFGDTATYLHGGTSLKNKEVMAPYLLHWEAIKLSKQAGFKLYDFGGVAPIDQPNHPWSGITRFKKGFGGFEVDTPGAYDIVFSPLWYNVYKNARKFSRILHKLK